MKEDNFLKLIKNPNLAEFLSENHVYVNETDFVEALPKQKHNKIYMCQQLSLDYRWSVVAKIADLIRLKNKYQLEPYIIWSDVDTSGGKNKEIATTKIRVNWPLRLKGRGVSLIRKSDRMIEIRFAKIPQQHFDNLVYALQKFFENVQGINEKINDIVKLYETSHQKLANFNYSLSKEIINTYFNTDLAYYSLHNIFITKQTLIKAIAREFQSYNTLFNNEISILNQLIPEFKVKKRVNNELPFHITCTDDFYRNKLFAKKVNGKLCGVCECKKCHKKLQFNFEDFSTDELKYISPDISLLIYLAENYNGYVGGISSSLYIIILNKILKQILDFPPIPTLISNCLLNKPHSFIDHDSLFYHYFCFNKYNNMSNN